MFDPEVFGRAMGEAIRMAVEPLQKEIADLKAKLAEKPDFTEAIAEQVKAQVAGIPVPKDGKDCDMNAVKEIIQEAFEAFPKPENGKNGTNVTMDDVRPVIEEAVRSIQDGAVRAVESAVKAIPEPQKGEPGAGVAGAMIDREGNLMLTLSNGEVKNLGPVVGKDGADFTDTTFEYDGERTLTIKGKGGEITKRLPIPMDRGYYRDGMPAAEKGDIVTHEGNAWIALKETKARPSADAKDDWRLFARKGRDGESVIRKVPTGPEAPIKLKD